MRIPLVLSHGSLALVALTLAACSSDTAAPTAPAAPTFSRAGANAETGTGAVYTMTNGTAANEVLAFTRAADGTLTALGTYRTGGTGTGGAVDPLQSQYALILSDDHTVLFAVDAGSNDVASFRVAANGRLTPADRALSGGTLPVSLAHSGNLLYVLNAGDNVVRGFRTTRSGALVPLPRAKRSLARGASGAAAIHFSSDGRQLIVAERVSNRLETFPVEANGQLGDPVVTPSVGVTPFGFDVAGGYVIVSEAANSTVSSYRLGLGGALRGVTTSLATGGRAACWLIATADGRYAYAVNSGNSTLTGVAIGAGGRLTLLDADGLTGFTGAGTVPLDPAFSTGEDFLYLLKGGSGSIGGFRVEADHGLTDVGDTPVAAPASGLQGLAAF